MKKQTVIKILIWVQFSLIIMAGFGTYFHAVIERDLYLMITDIVTIPINIFFINMNLKTLSRL